MANRILVGALVAGLFVFGGCREEPSSDGSPVPAPPVVAVVQIDTSSSYIKWAHEQLNLLAERLPSLAMSGSPAYTIYVRRVSEASWHADAAVLTIEIPAVPVEPPALAACPNPYDPRLCNERAAEHQVLVDAFEAELDVARDKAAFYAAALKAVTLTESPATDLIGAVKIASYLLADAPEGASRWWVLASDLRDCVVANPTCQPRALEPVWLPGVRVRVVGFVSDSPDGLGVIAEFRSFCNASGVTDVSVRLTDQPIVDVLAVGKED